MDQAKPTLDYITKSGKFVCRPKRPIFADHELKNAKGEVVRKATRDDIVEIAENGNSGAPVGEIAKITFGHTYDDIYDKDGNLIRKFDEKQQPAPVGYLLNYQTEEFTDKAGKKRLGLYADQWIEKVLHDDKGNPVNGPEYAATFPGRSPEYLWRRRQIDTLALLRRSPALPELGIDIVPYAEKHPSRIYYAQARDGSLKAAVVEDSRGVWRYALEDDMEPESTPASATNGAPPGSPAAPADDRPPMPQSTDELPEVHRQAAERYSAHIDGMHHTQRKALMHHVHAMYGASCGLPADKMAPHTPQAMAQPPAMPGATPGAAPGAAPAPGAPPAAGSQPGGGPPKPESKPPATEKERMSADQNTIDMARYEARLAAQEKELAELRQSSAADKEKAMYAEFERKLHVVRLAGRENYIDVAKEVETCKSRKYSQQQLDYHVEMLERIPPGSDLVGGGFLPVAKDTPPKRDMYAGTPDEKYRLSVEVQRYARANHVSMEDAEKAIAEKYQLNGAAQ